MSMRLDSVLRIESMRGTRGHRGVCRRARAAFFTMLLFNCSGKSDGGSTGTSRAGASGVGAAGVGSPAGSGGSGASQGGSAGLGGSGGGSSGGGSVGGGLVGGGSGGVPSAGQSASGGAGLAGEGGAPDGTTADGFLCERQTCVPGDVCVNCDFFGGAVPLICTPDPDLDPDGYQASIEEAGCLAVNPMFECDGAEDCASGERCVADSGETYRAGACVAEVPCEAPYTCVICRTEDDCPSPSSCGSEVQSVIGARRYCG
jgi:hypothetical protein